jgi:hypothetical protein
MNDDTQGDETFSDTERRLRKRIEKLNGRVGELEAQRGAIAVEKNRYKQELARVNELGFAKYLTDRRKRDCVEFFQWFWNQPGTNAEQGYDEWRASLGEKNPDKCPTPTTCGTMGCAGDCYE